MLGNKEVMAKNIKKYMKANKVSRSKMSEALNVSYSTLSDWINAKTYPRIDKIEMMANYFEVSKSDLVEDGDERPKIISMPAKTVPVLSKVRAGVPTYAEEHIVEYSYIPSFIYKENVEQFYLIIEGDSMDKMFKEGDMVLVEKNAPIENGQIGVVMINGYDATVKRVRFDEDKIYLVPESNNPEHLTQVYTREDEVIFVGRVTSSQQFH